MVEKLVFDDWKQVKLDMKSLDPRDRMRIKADLIKYVLPAKRAVDSTINIEAILERSPEEVADYILEKLMEKQGNDGSTE
jgi:hypothetical protein